MQHLTTTLTYLRARFGRDEDGATMVEYGLMVALIAIVAIVAVQTLGGGISGIFDGANEQLVDTGIVEPGEG
ncbi:Flp family type IVb pilin [Nitriliruptoraceae bacterium ZYF776]|nr:Flp family type IVb pilin [Profundirhabdus halotolerans]